MDPYQDEECLGRYALPGLTTDLVTAELLNQPLICKYWQKNTEQIQNRLVQAMMIVPSKSDCPGYIYGFRNQADYIPQATSYEIKMGRTKRSVPQQRIFEWQRDDNHKYVQIFTIRSEYNMKLEALVHLLFAYARKTLIINGKRRIEWFRFQEKVPTAAVVNLLNLVMEKFHELGNKNSPEITKIQEQIELRNENRRKQNKELGRILEEFKAILSLFIKNTHSDFIQKLRQLVRVNNIQELKSGLDILLQIIAHKSQNDKQVINVDSEDETETKSVKDKELITKIEKLSKFLGYIEQTESKGMTTKNATQKVKQAIYLILKQNPVKENPSKKQESPSIAKQQIKQSSPNTIDKKKIIQSYLNEDESQTAQTVVQTSKINKYQQIADNNTKKERQSKSQQKQSQFNGINQLQQEKKHYKCNRLTEVYNKLNQMENGTTFTNIVQGQFIIDCSHIIKHNITIIAKTIKVYQTWNIKFSTGVQSQSGDKLNLIIASKQFINFNKLVLPRQSKNGNVSVLNFQEDGNVIGLDEFLKNNPQKLKGEFYGAIKKLFHQNIK